MAISARTKTIVWSKAGARCSFADCRQHLIDEPQEGSATLLGELAHIVAQRPDGPRGDQAPPGGDIDGAPNLVLLCPTHHTLIDSQTAQFTVERLLQMKADHESWVLDTLSPRDKYLRDSESEPLISEDVHSTLLPVLGYPKFVYAATCTETEAHVRSMLAPPAARAVMLPYIVRSRQLFTFFNLRAEDSPFHDVIDRGSVERHESSDWWSNDDLQRWYVDLLNRSLNKLTGRRGLLLDKDHRRYFFPPDDGGRTRRVRYSSLTGRRQKRKVAWRPILKHSGEPRKYWEHLAVSLRFHHVAEKVWVLSVRPERRFTKDGHEPITRKGTGRRATSRKSRMYNEQVLKEVNFWRAFLSGGRPRIVFDFGEQSLMVSSEILRTNIEWPGVPDDVRRFTDLAYEEDLFTTVELDELESNGEGELDS